jgi:CHAD domain-containing protein
MARIASRTALLMRQRVNALSRSLPGARKGDADELHQARVATRRLREALPVVASGSRGRKLERMVRRLTRTLGPVRELDVALLTLDELAAAGDTPAAALTTLRQVMRSERRRLRAEMRRRLERIDLPKLQHRAAAVARKPRASRKSRVRDPRRLALAEERAARRAGRVRAAIENAAGLYLPDRLHEVRVAVKKLRYALELAQELSGSRATARVRTLKEAQDHLGRMHDLEVLIARIRGVQGSSSAPNLRLSGELDRLVRRLETECRQVHGHYMASRRKLLAICDHVADAPSQDRGAVSAA